MRANQHTLPHNFSDSAQWESHFQHLFDRIDALIARCLQKSAEGDVRNVIERGVQFFRFDRIDVRQSADDPFEIRQLHHLHELAQELDVFVHQTLYPIVTNLLEQHEQGTDSVVTLVHRCLHRVEHDLLIIQQAVEQRVEARDIADTLLVADKLIFKAIAPFRHLLPITQLLVPTAFFGERTHIHDLPYRENNILIGLDPQQSNALLHRRDRQTSPTFGLMAIPHEVGHFIYRRGLLDNGKTFSDISEQFDENPFYAWCEEMFADIYGCLVAGAVSVLGLQEMLRQHNFEMYEHGDGEHPTGIIRPLINSETLRLLSRDHLSFEAVAARLDERWFMLLEEQGIAAADVQAYFAEMREGIRPILEAFVSILLHHVNDKPWGEIGANDLSPAIPWTRGDEDQGVEHYRHELDKIAAQTVPSYTIHGMSVTDMEHRLHQIMSAWGDHGEGNKHTPDRGGDD